MNLNNFLTLTLIVARIHPSFTHSEYFMENFAIGRLFFRILQKYHEEKT